MSNNNKTTTISLSATAWLCALFLVTVLSSDVTHAFVITSQRTASTRTRVVAGAKPERLEENVDGPLFVNSKVCERTTSFEAPM
jgi:hypothetical protein